jgi:hypothetical protein
MQSAGLQCMPKCLAACKEKNKQTQIKPGGASHDRGPPMKRVRVFLCDCGGPAFVSVYFEVLARRSAIAQI